MWKSLIEELPKIVAEWKKEVEKIMENVSKWNRLKLQTNELVIPSKDSNYRTLFDEINREQKLNQANSSWLNRLIYWDNILVMAALLAWDEANWLESMR